MTEFGEFTPSWLSGNGGKFTTFRYTDTESCGFVNTDDGGNNFTPVKNPEEEKKAGNGAS